MSNNWITINLGELALVQGGFAFKSDAYIEEGIPLLRISNIKAGHINKDDIVYLPNSFLKQYFSFSGNDKDILIAMSGATTGKCARIKSNDLPCLINQRVGRFSVTDIERLNIDYLYHIVTTDEFLNNITIDAIGGAQPNISSNRIESFFITLPVIEKQRKIANILTTVDNLIEKTETLIAKYQSIKQGMMHDLFTRGVDANGQLRPPVDEAPELYKESELGWIPRGWEIVSIEDVATQVTDGDHHTPVRSNSGILLLSARNILNGKIFLKDVDYIPFSEYQRMIKRCFPQPGDILISCSGTIGRICEVPYNLRFGLVRSVALVKINTNKCLSRYAEWILRSEIIQSQILNSQLQAAQPNLFQGPIKKLLIPLPKIQEQESVYSKLDSLERCIKTETIKKSKMFKIKKGLMQDLLTGKVRVNPDKPKDTPS
ncbi:restriction endonuclease S subunit [Candidatus Magnetomorum sp. HK-1]|nr:restriction endonuclease S subunit [Candidatus Magnetomorum sp. HK-1]